MGAANYKNTRENEDERYTLAIFLGGRTNVAAYRLFLEAFVSNIVGQMVFRRRMHASDGKTEIFTVSDEALALLLIENNEDRWIDVYEKPKDVNLTTRTKKGEIWSSSVPAKFTQGGLPPEETKR